MHSVEYNERVI